MKIALLGFGTVGSGVVEVIAENQESINKRAGSPIEIKYILDKRDFEGQPINKLIVKDFNSIIEDEEVEIIAEAMGGIEPAYSFAKAALARGKSFVTSNKELVAKHGAELLELARQNKTNFLFEASVGGGIPIIRPLNQSLTADEIYEITGILNGTTNFILSKMKNEGRTFEEVLKEAQELGYAERNPEADVEGYDACRKIAILASLAFGEHVNFEDIPTTGITKITEEDMEYAAQMGCSIKLLATCQKQEGGIFARVAPSLISLEHPLAMVNDVFNGIFVKGNVIGEVMFYGKGAGKLPTASAVVADIVDAAKHKGTNIISFWNKEKLELKDKGQVKVSYFIRVQKDREDINKCIEAIFGKVTEVKALANEYAFITDVQTEATFSEKMNALGDIKVKSKLYFIK
ncbi:homoserine dehydrogenase [Sporanaerobium hydrogeniformans]|uniref:Homoserine dehydrogenase n=1 Tax=Sporanaerobium hydrogeniformans TaxID=3072179 RepID=A0AC61DIX0_9FIRM|nr:homoserine dehydrogenase [Sporanaerobium hydrogeniformans]PHV72017.1 homoserine dehydrogenase [Sporanaerobium hydrogeniformans]